MRPAEVDIAQQASKCEMSKVNRLVQFALIVLKPVKARIDLIPMIINPGRPTSRLGPKPGFVSNQDHRFTHALSEGVVCQHAPATAHVLRNQDTATNEGIEVFA